MRLNKVIVAELVKEFPTFYETNIHYRVKTATEPHKFRSHASILVP